MKAGVAGLRSTIIFSLGLLGALPAWSKPNPGIAARYIVFELDADGVPRAQSHQLVTLPTPLVSRTDAEMDSLGRAGLRDRELIAVRMKAPGGALVFQGMVEVPRWLNAEHGLFGESPLADEVFPAQKAFVVRLPLMNGAHLALAPAGGATRFTPIEIDLDALAADQNLPLARFEPRATLRELASNSGNRVDLLIMGDGYTAAQQAKFNTDSANLAANFFSLTPYAEYMNFVNTSTLFTASAQSGADHPPYNASCPATMFPTCCADTTMQTDPLQGTFVNTAFDGTFCSFNIHRLLVVNSSKVFTAAAAAPEWDKILVIVNDATYGGSGGGVLVASTHSFAVDIARHEYGHSFTNLADEYSDPYPGYPSCTDAPGTSAPCESNVTDQTSRSAIKWSPWILPSTPIPTTGTDTTIVGLFQGARYLASGMYRPQYSCLMRSLGVGFCRVCAQSYVLALYRGGWGIPLNGIDTIEPGSESPAPGAVSVTLPGSRTFSVSLLQPQGNTVTSTWYVNGVVAGSGASFTFSPSAPGSYTVLLKAHDDTSLVNATMGGALLDHTRTWTVNVDGSAGQSITEFAIPGSGPAQIAAGPDGALWFTEYSANKIGRITTAGVITEFPIPTVSSGPYGITAGPDGALWFTEDINQIGRITTAGVVTEFPIPDTPLGVPVGITAGLDGALWFTESGLAGYGNKIGRITTAGVITQFPIPTPGSNPNGITAGPDGALWFTEESVSQIGRITTAGVITEFPLPGTGSPVGITAGPDGALWFTSGVNKIGRINTAGVITGFPIPTASSGPDGITAGPDGALWFTEYLGNKIGRITTAGVITEFPIPTASSGPEGITAGPDGALWFTEYEGGKIGRISTSPAAKFFTVSPCRVADTRDVPGPSGGPPLSANTIRNFPVTGICGIPASATAVAINIAVFVPTDNGDLRVYPTGGTAPLASTINFRPGIVRANNAIVPLGAGGQISVQCDMPPGSPGSTNFFFDVYGYFQ